MLRCTKLHTFSLALLKFSCTRFLLLKQKNKKLGAVTQRSKMGRKGWEGVMSILDAQEEKCVNALEHQQAATIYSWGNARYDSSRLHLQDF